MPPAVVTLTQGNINNDHLYLTDVLSMFPRDSIGGSSEAHRGTQLLEVHSGIGDACAHRHRWGQEDLPETGLGGRVLPCARAQGGRPSGDSPDRPKPVPPYPCHEF